ncbi:hypothetical protein E8E13_005590 [Curvularia kusanoi]|uniref:Uncharacterized protein n=1 Tax=Curvularia kusanoi TaxID=90978 RepID=A0A9P4TM24_CURKU|nr:hypothetical protein E8E13_005590 [Curvularia kusanoi]
MRRRNELAEAFVDALQTPNQAVPGTLPTFGGTRIARNAIFKSVANILTHSVSLINEYDRLDKVIADTLDTGPENVSEAWTKDIEKIARLLKIGAKTAIRNVRKVLGAEIGDDGMESPGEDGEKMDTIDKMDLNYKLCEGLQYAERGVRKMVKSLPLDE